VVGVYTASGITSRLYQGEILSNVIERRARVVRARPDDGSAYTVEVDEIVHPYVVLATQDCELEQDARVRELPIEDKKRGNASLDHVLLVIASDFEQSTGRFPSSEIRKRARANKDERYQFLSAVPSAEDTEGAGVPSLVLDFKRFFTHPISELLGAIEWREALRRARLVTPYAEQLSDRLGHFIQRIGLPLDHHDVPSPAALPLGE
jgi:hypothetical protein